MRVVRGGPGGWTRLGQLGQLHMCGGSPRRGTLQSLVAERLTAVLLVKLLVLLFKSTGGSFACHLHLFKHQLI